MQNIVQNKSNPQLNYCGFIKFRGRKFRGFTINGCSMAFEFVDLNFRRKKDLTLGNLWAYDFMVRLNLEIYEIKCPTNINETTVFEYEHDNIIGQLFQTFKV